MIAEIVAALIVGVFALALVLEPLLRGRRPAEVMLELPDPEDTPRGMALAALREIEFDRATGKLSDIDYATLKSQYTGIALQAMRAEEQASAENLAASGAGSGAPGAVEAIIAAKVRALRSAPPSAGEPGTACPTCGPRPESDALFCSTCGNRVPTGSACAGCGASQPPGARFCEACGVRQAMSA